MEVIRVLLVDDHAVVRSGFAMVLGTESDIEVVAQAADGQQALDALATTEADIVLMDVQMPVMDGVQATEEIVANAQAKVIILTTFDREDYLFDALAAGASGFLLKNADPDDLIAAVRSVAAGNALLSPEVTLRVISRLTQQPPQQQPATSQQQSAAHEPGQGTGQPSAWQFGSPAAHTSLALDSLTAREREILGLMALGRSNAEIAAELFLGASTVKTHVSNVLAKTASRDRVQAVVFAYRTGLVPEDD